MEKVHLAYWSEDALHDVAEVVKWIRERDASAAERFLDCLWADVEMIERFPLSGAVVELTGVPPGLRSLPIRRYRKYLLFYSVTDTRIKILRLLLGSRDLESLWKRD
ncbi:MAG TPA: type II toxin-antitoxin system RelE/ParE family toxin [Tepidisphaeraceae bacterium]|nr:type II toxin-antitoxin system RelE/ParE family toxin [Tepidisphaeraceae bacterium]